MISSCYFSRRALDQTFTWWIQLATRTFGMNISFPVNLFSTWEKHISFWRTICKKKRRKSYKQLFMSYDFNIEVKPCFVILSVLCMLLKIIYLFGVSLFIYSTFLLVFILILDLFDESVRSKKSSHWHACPSYFSMSLEYELIVSYLLINAIWQRAKGVGLVFKVLSY